MPDNELKQQIESLVEQNKDAIVQGLSSILKFRTVTGATSEPEQQLCREETARCLEYLAGEAKRMGFDWKNVDNEYAYAQLGTPDTPFIAVPAHIDVVPPGEGWSHDPFGGEVAEGAVWGRGSQDDKGPAIEVLWAMQILKQLGLSLNRGVRLVLGTAEECGDWQDIYRYVREESEAEYAIIPDANFPIINGEKGMLNLRLQCTVAGDPSASVGGLRFKAARAGERSNIVPAVAELTFSEGPDAEEAQLRKELERFLGANPQAKAQMSRPEGASSEIIIRFEGKSAHGSAPEEGHNAAVDLLRFMSQSGFVSDDEADLANFLFEVGVDTSGARLGINETHSFIGPTTLNLGILRWSAGEAEVVLNIRVTMGLTPAQAIERVEQRLKEFAEETGFEANANAVGKTLEAIYVNPEEYPRLIESLQEAYSAITGREATLKAIGGTTYAKAFARAVCFGPVDPAEEPELIHQANERVSIDHLLRNVKIYSYALAKLCTA